MVTSDNVYKNLLFLLGVFLLGYAALIAVHLLFARMSSDLDSEVKNEYARYKIGEYILKEISSVEKNYYQMAMAFREDTLKPLKKEILEEIDDINKAIDVLENGGVLESYIRLNLVGISESVDVIEFTPNKNQQYTYEAIDLRPKLEVVKRKLSGMSKIIEYKAMVLKASSEQEKRKIRFKVELFFKQIPPLFIRMKENASRLLYDSKENLTRLEKNIQEQKAFYTNLEYVVTFLVMLLVGIFGFILSRQIQRTNEELKNVTLKAKKSAKEASQASQIKSQFLANMSHEIRTPLNAIIGFSELLSKANLSKDETEKANIIVKSAKALLDIINDILDISKVESGKFELINEPFNLKKVLEQIVELYSVNARQKEVRFLYNFDPAIPVIFNADATRLKQVLSNILSNAIKFTPAEGRVTFDVSLLKKSETKATLHFSIKDSGVGITPDQQTKIFEPFTQADGSVSKKFGGTGLGLSISLKIVELMGSKIELKSVEDEGSEFFFDLEMEISAKEIEEKTQKKYTFVIAPLEDDVERIRSGLKTTLGEFGEVLENEQAYASRDDVDLIFCFGQNGLLDRLKSAKQKFGAPAVYVGDIRKVQANEALDALMDYYIDAPIYGSKVFNIIATACSIEQEALKNEISPEHFHGKVLVAEDNLNNQILIRVLLEKFGLTCDIANNGQEAVELYKESAYDLVFLDINMPVMDGLTALSHIRQYEKEHQKRIPMVALTANTIKGDKERYLKAGMDGYLAKPINNDSLTATLQKYLNNSDLFENVNDSTKTGKKAFDKDILMARIGLDEASIDVLLDGFFSSLPEDIARIEKAITNANKEELKQALHYLKGSASNYAMDEAAKFLEQLESKALRDTVSMEDITSLKKMFDDVRNILKS